MERPARRLPLALDGALGELETPAVILGALVELLDAELPQDAALRMNGRTVRRGALLDALREYVDTATR